MKKKEKQMIGILILVAVIIITIIYFATRPKEEESVTAPQVKNEVKEEFVQVLDNGTKLNTSTKLSEMKQYKGLKIGNIQLTNDGSKTQLIADVTNPTQSNMQAMLIKIILLDKNGNEIATLAGRISPIKAGQTMQFSTSAMIDYANAYDFKIIENN